MAFTEEEQSKILQYLGYPKQTGLVSSQSDGYRLTSPSLDYVYAAILRLSPEGEQRVREDLRELACVDAELGKLWSKAAIEGTGDIKFNVRSGRAMLLGERRRLVTKLADDLGAPPNPLSHANRPRVTNT